jgi:chromosome segregation protein
LRALHRDIHRLAESIQTATGAIDVLKRDLSTQQARLQTLLSEHTEIAKLLSKQEQLSDVIRQQGDQVESSLSDLQSRLDSLRRQNQTIEQQLETDRIALTERETELTQKSNSLAQAEAALTRLDEQLADCGQKSTVFKVRLAKAEQRLQSQRSICDDLMAQGEQLQASVRAGRHDLAAGLWSRRASGRDADHARVELAQQQTERTQCQNELDGTRHQLEEIERKAKQARELAMQIRDQVRHVSDSIHQLDMRLEKVQIEKSQLAQRLKDDYGIDLWELGRQDETPSQQAERSVIDAEISSLRQKLGSIGSVNMDALEELESLERRYQSLDAQYRDLAQSKEALERIIQRINNESRRLFLETLDAIRANFQQLFRQTFGGGRADIVLEEGVDVLDAGVEIVATPPGKPEFNNSLLSGGEKALAAVSLLMAIFKFRPSPFCVLDEVDAPFDEANIGRFIEVLRSFLGWTKFVIVTHSKKTMTAATTLYGVTMQESGVSKRVSVRFEEVGEDGQIAPSATERTDDADAAQRGVA